MIGSTDAGLFIEIYEDLDDGMRINYVSSHQGIWIPHGVLEWIDCGPKTGCLRTALCA